MKAIFIEVRMEKKKKRLSPFLCSVFAVAKFSFFGFHFGVHGTEEEEEDKLEDDRSKFG